MPQVGVRTVAPRRALPRNSGPLALAARQGPASSDLGQRLDADQPTLVIDDAPAHLLHAVGEVVDLALHQDDAADAVQQAVHRAHSPLRSARASTSAKYRRILSNSVSAAASLASV